MFELQGINFEVLGVSREKCLVRSNFMNGFLSLRRIEIRLLCRDISAKNDFASIDHYTGHYTAGGCIVVVRFAVYVFQLCYREDCNHA